MSQSKMLSILLGKVAFAVLAVIALVPVVWTVGPAIETLYFPVVVNNVDENGDELPIVLREQAAPDHSVVPYVDVSVTFKKVRNCEFIVNENASDGLESSLSWYTKKGVRLPIDFGDKAAKLPASRVVGPQAPDVWRIYGVTTVEGTFAIVEHRCHPLWRTQTKFFP